MIIISILLSNRDVALYFEMEGGGLTKRWLGGGGSKWLGRLFKKKIKINSANKKDKESCLSKKFCWRTYMQSYCSVL